MDLQEIKKFFEENKDNAEVKTYLEELSAVSVDKVKGFLETDEGKKLLQPRLDQHFAKSLETWKNNNLQKLIDEEIKKRYPDEDPKDKTLRELQRKIEQMEKEKLYESLKNKALKIATEKKLPVQLIDFMIGEDEEKTISNLSQLEEVWNSQLQALVDEKLKSSGTNPGDGNPPTTFTKDQLNNMSIDEINKHWDSIKNTQL
ncbi:DUF4355 domain-containing protein [Tuberibacillus calidus]|uniref:DUF4355 domain-containing protein n=1 Tax=Tuberibacillus calidus TaxID=340097 RepID=UPI0003FC9D6C|nr:DUF4355 domain-containing protein [Tuberibacillus calidus]